MRPAPAYVPGASVPPNVVRAYRDGRRQAPSNEFPTPVACSCVLLDYFQNESCWPLGHALTLVIDEVSAKRRAGRSTDQKRARFSRARGSPGQQSDPLRSTIRYRAPLTYTHPTTHCSCGGRSLIAGLSTSGCAHVPPRQESASEPRRVLIASLASNITLGELNWRLPISLTTSAPFFSVLYYEGLCIPPRGNNHQSGKDLQALACRWAGSPLLSKPEHAAASQASLPPRKTLMMQ